MIKLIVKDINGYDYKLIDIYNREYKINIEFYDLKDNPKIGDLIYISESLLKDINNSIAYFGKIDEKYGKMTKEELKDEIICLKINNMEIHLKRFYG